MTTEEKALTIIFWLLGHPKGELRVVPESEVEAQEISDRVLGILIKGDKFQAAVGSNFWFGISGTNG